MIRQRRTRPLFLAFLLAAGLGAVLGCEGSGNRSRRRGSASNSISVSTADLLDKYATDEAGADRRYKDKFVEIEAEVAVGTDRVETERIIVKPGKRDGSILCLFEKEWRDELAKAKVGGTKRIRGRCMGKWTHGGEIKVWLGNCTFPDALPMSPAEVRANEKRMQEKQDALLASLKAEKRPVFDCALDAIRRELPRRFGYENTEDAVIPTDYKELQLERQDALLLDDQGREDIWVVHGRLVSKDRQGKKCNMRWEVTVISYSERWRTVWGQSDCDRRSSTRGRLRVRLSSISAA